jgi:DNA topoisomerase VI subunit B
MPDPPPARVPTAASPAQFSENKNIAGFDNAGKSLYTTIRELVENSLDACETVETLPDIEISLEELDSEDLNKHLGVVTHERIDQSLFERARESGGKKKTSVREVAAGTSADADAAETSAPNPKTGAARKASDALFYRVTVRDNGCGMKHEQSRSSSGASFREANMVSGRPEENLGSARRWH